MVNILFIIFPSLVISIFFTIYYYLSFKTKALLYDYKNIFFKKYELLDQKKFIKMKYNILERFFVNLFFKKLLKEQNERILNFRTSAFVIFKIYTDIQKSYFSSDEYQRMLFFSKLFPLNTSMKYIFEEFLFLFFKKNNKVISYNDLNNYLERYIIYLDEIRFGKRKKTECQINKDLYSLFFDFKINEIILDKKRLSNNINERYELLLSSLAEDSSLIKKQYRFLSKIYHPDKGGSVETMKKINNLYSSVSSTASFV